MKHNDPLKLTDKEKLMMYNACRLSVAFMCRYGRRGTPTRADWEWYGHMREILDQFKKDADRG